ncbi:hypothetical protein [Yinghuangia seranimata]|uniref:hypothetical protein n=1 Tax=Yinghuangia seranimata TaxID=408067 RepID=UPI00248A9175|nr:hypothetical protein [Yinghuangia seranimata]MDI2132172.1 hypothetical protein [Yinghuangia seranimata]
MTVPLEESEPAKHSFAQLSPGEQAVAAAALDRIRQDPRIGDEIPGWREPMIEYTYTTCLAPDSAEAVTLVYQYTPGFGVTVVYYFRDPLLL